MSTGIDQAQSLGGGLIEGIGKKVDSPSMQQYGQDVQKQQEKDMAEGGYQFEYGSFRDAYEKKMVYLELSLMEALQLQQVFLPLGQP